MKISIITVCYNSSKTIERTFKSIKDQTYKDIEYIVVDGGSKDKTLNIVKQYEDLIDEWISESDKGLYDAMNKGIKMATGDIIGILNSDDILYDNHVLENIASFHKTNDIDASVGDIIQFNEEGKTIRKYSAANWKPQKLKIGFMPPHPAIFFRRNLFEKLGYYHLDFIIGADYELIVRFFLKHNITWKYSGLVTTKMLLGGLSSSGLKSYRLISKEIGKALHRNNIKFSKIKISLRACWKFIGFLKPKK